MGKSVLLIIGGGIAAYKSLLLIRELARRGVSTRVILTRGGTEFVTPLSAQALSGATVFTDLWDLTAESEMGHIELSRSADLIVVAPATANILAQAAHGVAGDLATTTLLATDKRVLFAPAMNVRMYESEATQANISTLAARGAMFVGPDAGEMACGEFGDGRMAEPDAIADAVMGALLGDTTLDGLRAPKPLAG
ncbi:MAG: flavoprotein, partial [Litorimonas sp.]